jgi:hypothetical protein
MNYTIWESITTVRNAHYKAYKFFANVIERRERKKISMLITYHQHTKDLLSLQ